jgi:hypothetical protein
MTRHLLLCSLTAMTLLGMVGCRHCRRGCDSRADSSAPRGRYLESPSRGRGDILIPPPTGAVPRGEFAPDSGSLPLPTLPSEPLPSRFRPPPLSVPAPRETVYPEGWLEEPAYQKKTPSEPPAVLPLPGDTPTSSRSSSKPTVAAGYTERINPTGLPNFIAVSDRVFNGRKPNVEGFDTLRNAGVKTLVYLHAPNQDVSPTRDLAEKKGFQFVGIPINESQPKAAFGTFAETIGDKKYRPIFVFDEDGTQTGAMWYRYFRKIESMNDDAARVKASPLGLRPGTNVNLD